MVVVLKDSELKPTMADEKVEMNPSNERDEVLLDKGDGMLDAGQLTKCKNAVCYIFCNKEDSEKRGTGFFACINICGVPHKVIVTNNHVLGSREEASCAAARFHYEGKLQGADLRLKPSTLFYTDKALDYTIIGCDHDTIENGFCIDPLDFEEESSELKAGDDIFIFQHPKGDSKKVSYQRISRIQRPFVYYDADTDIGSSGSAVLRKFKLIAVHSKGSDLLRYNKGTLCSEILHHLRTGTYKQPPMVQASSESAFQTKRKVVDRQDDIEMEANQISNKRRCKQASENSITQEEYDSSKPTAEKLEELSKDIVTYWKHLGRTLKLPYAEIERIQKDHYNYDDICEKALAMLLAWVETSSDATVATLREALVKQRKIDTAQKHFPV